MNTISISIKDDYIRKDGTANIFLRIYINNKSIKLPTDINVKPDFFDYVNKRIKSIHPKADEYNMIILKAVERVNDIFIRFKLQEEEITREKLRKAYNNPTNYINVYKWMESELEESKGLITHNTHKQRKSFIKKLKEYKKDAIFSDIDSDFINNFEKWLKNKRGNNINTINKNLKLLRFFMNLALKNNLINKNPFIYKKIKEGASNIIYVEKTELMNLISKYNNFELKLNLHKTLQFFLFACTTGLRISDVRRVTHEMILNDTLIFEPLKTKNTTGKIIKIPLTDFARKLIKDAGKFKVSGAIFDMYSDQKTNQYLKEIMKLAGIKKPITFHMARHTFATLFLEETNDLASLQQLLGHSSITQTMIYAHVSEKKKQDQIKKFGEIFDQ